MEVLFDGEPRAAADLATYAQAFRAESGEGRDGLSIPAERAVVDGLSAQYANADLGDLVVRRDGEKTVARPNRGGFPLFSPRRKIAIELASKASSGVQFGTYSCTS